MLASSFLHPIASDGLVFPHWQHGVQQEDSEKFVLEESAWYIHAVEYKAVHFNII